MNILVTGVSRGLGNALLNDLFNQGHQVIGVTSNHDFVKNYQVRSSVNLLLTNWNDPFVLSQHIKEVLNNDKLDILINNAGMLKVDNLHDLNKESLFEHYKLNASHPVLLCIELFKCDCFSKGAHIVNIGSMGGFQGSSKYKGLLAYSMSKAALAAATECLSVEFDGHISVNCLCLGSFDSEMFRSAFPNKLPAVSLKTMTKFVCDFALGAGKVMNGKIIPVNISNP